MFFFRVAEFFKWLIALVLSTALFGGVAFLNSTAFPFEGEKEYYLYSLSSQAQIKDSVTLAELPFVRGESVTLENVSEGFLEELLLRYGATVLKTEEFSDGVSYYCYSPKLKRGIVLDGELVNLHVAVGTERTVVGTPVIFGGY